MASSSSGGLSLFARHQLKVLNVGLVLYLCLGTLLFNWLGEYEQTRTNQPRKSSGPGEQGESKRQNEASLQDLRLQSVRHMWNITNQLNILYESNWTLLVLNELVEFERKFLDSLVAEGGSEEELESDKGEGEREEEERKRKDKDEGESEDNKRQRKSRRWSRSIRKSLIHSVATITTLGSPSGSPRSPLGKLSTLVYGALGVPLLLITVGQSGRRLAHKSLNLFLVLRHYCLALPSHYLRRACHLTSCLRLLAWCCCCCCCCFSGAKSGSQQQQRDQGAKLCDTKPRLRLRRAPTGGARRSKQASKGGNNQKSVRFVGQTSASLNELATIGHNHWPSEPIEPREVVVEEENLFSRSTFLMSLTLLGGYLWLGAYAYSHHYNKPLLDGFFVCYEFISGTKWPESHFVKDPKRMDPASTYELLKSNPIQKLQADGPPSLESFVWHLLYLVGGLNLISMCGHYAHLWVKNSHHKRQLGDFLLKPLANGFLDSSDEPSNLGANHMGAYQQQVPSITANGPQLQPLEAAAEHFMSQTANLIQQPSEQQAHIGLAELYVVGQQQQSNYQLRNPAPVVQQQQQTSDLSFASTDRSTDRASLCLHHQQANQQQHLAPGLHSASSAGSNLYGPQIYGHHHYRQPQQPRLYLANGRQEEEEEEEEAEEVDRVLKSCLSSSQCRHMNHQMRPYGGEQDDTNTTTSSTLSRTTLKPTQHLHLHQHQHQNQPIGFLLTESTTENDNVKQ